MPKSCLKLSATPPLTPDLSAAPTPSTSGRASPTSSCSSGGAPPRLPKTVSFCAEATLEEVYFADEWDRSPAPVTPKLSYQDVLELKQLQMSLPRAPQPSTYRQPFTTSSPTSYTFTSGSNLHASGSSPQVHPGNGACQIPTSRFAAQPSQTPSRWKNRHQQSDEIDPDILPYLDAVPIRLLPLLDSNASPPPTHMTSTARRHAGLNPNTVPASEPSFLSTSSLPSPSSPPMSNMSASSPLSSQPSQPAQPPPPPSITLSSPSGTLSTPSPPRRTPQLNFLPLLPVSDTPTPAPEPIIEKTPEPRQRRFSMTFVPLMDPTAAPAPSEGKATEELSAPEASLQDNSQTSEPPLQPEPGTDHEQEQSTPTLGPIDSFGPPSASVFDVDTDAEDDADADFRAQSPEGTSTPSLSSASASDTDTDTDVENDQDGVDMAPHGMEERGAKEAGGLTSDPSPGLTYFYPRDPSTAGQTPPLAALYPGLATRADVEVARDTHMAEDGGWGVDMRWEGLPKRAMLAALPSPALIPPSPFSLYPPTGDGVEGDVRWRGSPFVPLDTTLGGVKARVSSNSSLVVEPRSSPLAALDVSPASSTPVLASTNSPARRIPLRRTGATTGLGLGLGLGIGVQVKGSVPLEDVDMDAGTGAEQSTREAALLESQ